MMQVYDGIPSSRVKDLVDLVISKLTDTVDADALLKKIGREVTLRHMERINAIRVPSDWKTTKAASYKKEAQGAQIPTELADVTESETAVASWLNPVLHGELAGMQWNPHSQCWANAKRSKETASN
ncbi:hypothetical protein B5F33_03065 [Collinsella sp. An2]|nr:hypothetical protein [Collinsella sp. An2]OUP10052.1 hypothetical protein B5F33_03065 [Collinsella sp. An2]